MFAQKAQSQNNHALTSDKGKHMAPHVQPGREVIQILRKDQTRGRKTAHYIKAAVKEAFGMSAQKVGNRAEKHQHYPRQRRNNKAEFPVYLQFVRARSSAEQHHQQADNNRNRHADYKVESRVPFGHKQGGDERYPHQDRYTKDYVSGIIAYNMETWKAHLCIRHIVTVQSGIPEQKVRRSI